MQSEQDILNSLEFVGWYKTLKATAEAHESLWLIATDPSIYLSIFLKGVSPEDEFQSLVDLAEWRGCGCGGGG